MKGLNACESTVSSELVQWASVLLTVPIKEQVYLADNYYLFFCSGSSVQWWPCLHAVDSKHSNYRSNRSTHHNDIVCYQSLLIFYQRVR